MEVKGSSGMEFRNSNKTLEEATLLCINNTLRDRTGISHGLPNSEDKDMRKS